MKKTANIFLKDDLMRIVTYATTTMGLTIGHVPVYFLKLTDDPEIIGLKALEALNGFKERVVHHPKTQEEWKENSAQWCKNLHISSSWRTFLAKGAKDLDLEMEDDIITLTPTKNLIMAKIKGRGDFDNLPQKSRTSSPIPEELGRAILDAFNDCD